MKILEVCPYSTPGCGVWARAYEESKRLAEKGHKVLIFSSDFVKGKDETAKSSEMFGSLEVKRFSSKKIGGESFMYFNYKKEAISFSPDVIIVHNYRHLHTTQALSIAKEVQNLSKKPCKVFLITHAPFVEGNITRSFLSKLAVKLYDSILGPITLNKFDKILTISNWEVSYLLDIGAKKEKIFYIPNGIPEEFFRQKPSKEEHKILFLGRISTKKKLETLISAIPLLEDKKIKVEIVGPPEEAYLNSLKLLASQLNVPDRVIFSKPIFDIKEKIKKLDSAKIFVLPSRVEGMPQALIEAMARKKLVIGSDSIAIRDLIKDNQNGYLFEFNNPKSLAEKISLALSKNNKNISKNALESVRKFSWDKIIKDYERLIKER